jgi:hypothetical protein
VVGRGNLHFAGTPGQPGDSFHTSSSFALFFAADGTRVGSIIPDGEFAAPGSAADPGSFFLAHTSVLMTSVVKMRDPGAVEWTCEVAGPEEDAHVEAVAPLTDGRVAVLLTVNVAVPEPGDIQRLLILGADGNVLSDTPLQADDGVAQDLFPGPDGSLVTVDTTRQGRPEYSRYDPRDLLIRRRDEAGRILASLVVADRCAYQGQLAAVPTAGSLAIGAFACDRTVLFPDDEAGRVRCFSAGEQDLMLLSAEWP